MGASKPDCLTKTGCRNERARFEKIKGNLPNRTITMAGNRSEKCPRSGITLQASSHNSAAYHQGMYIPPAHGPSQSGRQVRLDAGTAWATGLTPELPCAEQAATSTTSPRPTNERTVTVRHYEVTASAIARTTALQVST